MYLLIGKENCSRCDMVKNILDNKNIEYQYVILDELETEEKNKYIKMAREMKKLEMPLIIKDEFLYDVKEVIA
jgi:glutaredoxin